MPLWGVIEPGAAEAARVSDGKVGVIATEATIASQAYTDALRRYRPELTIVSQACQLFVALVEEGWEDEPAGRLIADRYLEPLLEAQVDTVVLGCTHYPLLADTIGQVMGDGVRLVDSAETVARVAATALADLGLLAADGKPVEHHFCVTDSADRFRRIARHVLRDEVSLELVDVP